MQKKQVSVIDIGSSKLTVAIGERGVNKTFIIKARKDFKYDGFADGEFFDVDAFRKTLKIGVDFLRCSAYNSLDTVFVGVPGEFTQVIVKESQISFSKKKKITVEDINSLYDAAFVAMSMKKTLINRSPIVYELDDSRRILNPVGMTSEILKGVLSFILCSDYFIDIVKSTLNSAGIKKVEFVSTSLAEVMYLLEPEMRDRIAILVDVGYISTTFTLVQGDGVLYQESFGYGGGYVSAALTEKFDMQFNDAEELKSKINLCRFSESSFELLSCENGEYYDVNTLNNVVKSSLDVLCERIENAMESSGYSIPEYVPILITGGGISYLRGAKEHLASRLNSMVKIIAPSVPLMEKPSESSFLSLLDLSIEQLNNKN